jgi:GR25 family glycosyltransferase involved in LPS biosynthesis
MKYETKVISLPAPEPRRETMKELLDGLQFPFEFYEAFNPALCLPEVAISNLLQGKFLTEFSRDKRPGTYGCSYTHLRLWSQYALRNSDLDFVMVMEDDVSLAPNFKYLLLQTISELPPTFDLCFLGGWPSDPRFQETQPCYSRFLRRMSNFCLTSTAIYILNLRKIKQFIEIVTPFTDEIDVHLASFREKLEIYLYAGAYPCCLTQVSMGSVRLHADISQ